MIEDARKSAAVDSAYGYIKAVEYEIGLDELKNKNRFKDGKEDVENLDINVKGTKPTYGEIEIKNKNIIYANMCINGYMITYENEKAKAFDRCTGSYDKTGPEIILGQVSGTTNSLTIEYEIIDNESEIKEIKCYYGIDKKYEKEGKIENNKCIITGLKNNTTYNYKIEATNAGGITSTKEGSEKTRNFEGVEIKVDTSEWAQSKEITIIGSTEGSKLQYQLNGHEEDKWIDIEDGYTFTLKENGTIYARLYDGENASEEVEMTIINIDTTAPTCTWDGESTSWRQSATIKATCADTNGSGCTTATSSKLWVYTNGTETTKTASLSYTIEDKAGNTTTCGKTANVYVDRTAPTCTFSNESTNWRQSATIKATCADTNGSGCTTSTSSKSWAYTNGTTTIKTASLSYTIEDNVGNTATCEKTANVYVDRTIPTLELVGTGSDASTIIAVIKATDNVQVTNIKKSNNTLITGTSSTLTYRYNTTSDLNDVIITATDLAGNSISKTLNIKYLFSAGSNHQTANTGGWNTKYFEKIYGTIADITYTTSPGLMVTAYPTTISQGRLGSFYTTNLIDLSKYSKLHATYWVNKESTGSVHIWLNDSGAIASDYFSTNPLNSRNMTEVSGGYWINLDGDVSNINNSQQVILGVNGNYTDFVEMYVAISYLYGFK